jgi:hypothetical protein
MSIDLLAQPVVDFLAEEQPPVVDFLGEEIRRKNPPYMCVCEHTLMVHFKKDIGTGLYTSGKGPCNLVINGVRCSCTNAVPKE